MHNSNRDIPLVVDLDGTLIKTDLLYENINACLTSHPLSVFSTIKSLLQGKAALKTALSVQYQPDFCHLPFNAAVIDWLKAERQGGRQLILATASHEKFALQAAAYLGIFDEVLATDAHRNLKSGIKRDVLVERYGEKGFDYVGDTSADKPVWQAARYAHVVAPSKSLLTWLQQQADLKQVFSTAQGSAGKAFMRALRPHQWAKNGLLFIPLLTAHLYTEATSVWLSLLAFLVFCITASSVYLLNDLVDITNDRQHPHKRQRPFASGQLSVLVGWLAWPLLLLLAFSIGMLTLPLAFMAVLAIYYSLTLGYSLYFKRQPIVDVLVLAGLYTLRIVAGTTALGVALSFWLLSFSMYIFLSLAFMKRVSDMKLCFDTADAEHRLAGRGYQQDDFALINTMGVVSGFLSVVFLALYVHSQEIVQHYHYPALMGLLCPLLLFWVLRAWFITHRGGMHDDPVWFALKDSPSWVTGGLFVLIFLAGKYLP